MAIITLSVHICTYVRRKQYAMHKLLSIIIKNLIRTHCYVLRQQQSPESRAIRISIAFAISSTHRFISYLERGSVQKLQLNAFDANLIFWQCNSAEWKRFYNFFYCALLLCTFESYDFHSKHSVSIFGFSRWLESRLHRVERNEIVFEKNNGKKKIYEKFIEQHILGVHGHSNLLLMNNEQFRFVLLFAITFNSVEEKVPGTS